MTVNTKAGKINAAKDTLNRLAIYAGEAANLYEQAGHRVLAADAQATADALHDALAALGYYDF